MRWLTGTALALVIAGCGDSASPLDAGPGVRVRVMAANTTAGSAQSYDSGEGIRLFQGLHPDVALVQELNYAGNTGPDIRAFVDTAFGPSFSYFRETGQIPNGVVSRFPILSSGSWTDPQVANRGFAWARLDLPGPHELWAVSVHLLTTKASERTAEAAALVALLQQNVPAGDYVVVGGDLNTATRDEGCIDALAQVVSTAPPYPADNVGNDNTSGPRTKPHDWVLAAASLRALERPVAIGAQSFAGGLVVDSRVYAPLADLAPVLAGDSGAVNMQHMPVVRDFVVGE